MKHLFFTFLFLFLFSTSFSQENLLLLFDDDGLPPIIKQYNQRVKEVGGEIIIASRFLEQLKLIKSNNYLDSLVFWVTSYGGVKKINDSVIILYELRGDDLKSTQNYYPLLFKDTTTNESSINFTGNNYLSNSDFSITQPFTLILTVKQNEPTENECIFNSGKDVNYSITTDKKNELEIDCSKKLKAISIDTTKSVIIIEFNGDLSKVYINNILAASGKLDQNQLNGIILGKDNKNNPNYFSGYLYNCGIFNCILSTSFIANLYNVLK